MVKRIEIEWPEIGIKVNATLLEEEEPKLCGILWKILDSPLKMFCRHTLSTGYVFSGEGRPARHPEKFGIEVAPIDRKQWLPTRTEPGSVVYPILGSYGTGYGIGYGIEIIYGPCTEPVLCSGSVVAKVDEENMDSLIKAGKAVWNAQYMTHRSRIMIARRKES